MISALRRIPGPEHVVYLIVSETGDPTTGLIDMIIRQFPKLRSVDLWNCPAITPSAFMQWIPENPKVEVYFTHRYPYSKQGKNTDRANCIAYCTLWALRADKAKKKDVGVMEFNLTGDKAFVRKTINMLNRDPPAKPDGKKVVRPKVERITPELLTQFVQGHSKKDLDLRFEKRVAYGKGVSWQSTCKFARLSKCIQCDRKMSGLCFQFGDGTTKTQGFENGNLRCYLCLIEKQASGVEDNGKVSANGAYWSEHT